MDEIRAFKKEKNISFLKRKHLVQFVSKFFAFEYQKSLEASEATAISDCEELQLWKDGVENEVEELKKALYKVLNFLTGCVAGNWNITNKSFIFKIAFKMAKINRKPEQLFSQDITYRIDGCDFMEF